MCPSLVEIMSSSLIVTISVIPPGTIILTYKILFFVCLKFVLHLLAKFHFEGKYIHKLSKKCNKSSIKLISNTSPLPYTFQVREGGKNCDTFGANINNTYTSN